MRRTNTRCIIQLREPKRTNRELIAEINDGLCQLGSRFNLRAGGWNPKKQEQMEEWKIWDFRTGRIVGWRKKDEYLAIHIYHIDVLRAILNGNIGERIYP
jgi:hypothetical protein